MEGDGAEMSVFFARGLLFVSVNVGVYVLNDG